MKILASIILAALALPVSAGRTETHILYEGTLKGVSWLSIKDGGWSPFFAIDFLGPDYRFLPDWTIPAFDTIGGTRIATGISINVTGNLQGTFNASSEGRNRMIEGYYRNASLTAVVYGLGIDYTYEVWGQADVGEEATIPTADQKSTMTWNLNSDIVGHGFIVNNRGPDYFSYQKFSELTKGDARVNMAGRVGWFPFYRFDGVDEVRNYADCGTSWAIPNELSNSAATENVDALGRSLKWLVGTPGFPNYESNQRTVGRVGAATPMRLEAVYYYTQVGDADHGLDPYYAAGNYSDDFAALDSYGAPEGRGDRVLQPGQWVFLEGAVVGLPWNPFYEESDARRSFEWMDTDRNGLVSPAEFLAWRNYVATFLTRYNENRISQALPKKDWTPADPTPKQALAKLLKLPTLGEKAFLSALDRDKNQRLSRAEWSPLYPLAAFKRLDSNNNGVVSLLELTSARIRKSTPALVANAVARTDCFLTLDKDVHYRMDRDSKISRGEVEKMWQPGTDAKKIDSVWESVAGSNLKTIRLTQWLEAGTLPSISQYMAATAIRRARSSWFNEHSWFDSQEDLSRSEFDRLFEAGTSSKVIDESWRVANNTPEGKSSPETIDSLAFVECRLIDAILK